MCMWKNVSNIQSVNVIIHITSMMWPWLPIRRIIASASMLGIHLHHFCYRTVNVQEGFLVLPCGKFWFSKLWYFPTVIALFLFLPTTAFYWPFNVSTLSTYPLLPSNCSCPTFTIEPFPSSLNHLSALLIFPCSSSSPLYRPSAPLWSIPIDNWSILPHQVL